MTVKNNAICCRFFVFFFNEIKKRIVFIVIKDYHYLKQDYNARKVISEV